MQIQLHHRRILVIPVSKCHGELLHTHDHIGLKQGLVVQMIKQNIETLLRVEDLRLERSLMGKGS